MSNGIANKIEKTVNQLLERRLGNWLLKNHPKIHKWILSRFSLQGFVGLPLTVLFAVFVLNSFLLGEVIEDIVNSETLTLIDSRVAKFFFVHRSDSLAKAFYIITQLGNPYVVSIIASLLALYLYTRQKLTQLIGLVITLAGSMITMALGKHIFQINRPHQFAYYSEISFSFPSGHATIATSFYLFIFYLLIGYSWGIQTRIILGASAIIISALIGFSRLYLCVHYLSDVLGGFALGIGWLLLSITVIEWKRTKN